MFLDPESTRTAHVRAQADELPRAHASLFGGALRSYRELPLRYAEAATLHRDELAGALHGLLRVRHVTQDDAHIFCTAGADRGRGRSAASTTRYSSTTCFGLEIARRALDPAGEQARHRRGVGLHRGARCARRSSGAGSTYVVNEGDGAFYGPKIDLHMTDALGRAVADRDDPARLPDAAAVRAHATWAPTTPSTPPYVDPPRADRLVRALHRHPDRALRRRVPVLARAGPGARDPGRARPPRGGARALAAQARGLSGSRWTTPTRPSASGSATPSWTRSRSWSSTATKESDEAWRCASTAASQTTRSLCWNCSPSLLPLLPEKQGRNRLSPPGADALGGSTERVENGVAAACQRFCKFIRGGATRAW